MPQYDSLKLMLAGILRHFLTLDASPGVTAPQAETAGLSSERDGGGEREREDKKLLSPLEVRMAQLERYIEQLPRNVEDRRKLTDHGYSDRLWDQVSVV